MSRTSLHYNEWGEGDPLIALHPLALEDGASGAGHPRPHLVEGHDRDGRRRNANPDMVTVVKKYTDEDLDAVVDYMSRLEWPERTAVKK